MAINSHYLYWLDGVVRSPSGRILDDSGLTLTQAATQFPGSVIRTGVPAAPVALAG